MHRMDFLCGLKLTKCGLNLEPINSNLNPYVLYFNIKKDMFSKRKSKGEYAKCQKIPKGNFYYVNLCAWFIQN
jgi:hypothetical protein